MSWSECKNMLVIRADNMGDLIMSSPAIRAIKENIDCRVTVLTSPIGAQAAALIPEIDESIVASLPWVKSEKVCDPDGLTALATIIKEQKFDGCIIFTVYSQNPLPSALLSWLARIPRRMGYCRENPYDLLNYWVPDEEPLSIIRHQVERDLHLVAMMGIDCTDDRIRLKIPSYAFQTLRSKLRQTSIRSQGYIILHAGVSEPKRAYPEESWMRLGREIIRRYDLSVFFTGSAQERQLTERLQKGTGEHSYALGGRFSLEEFAGLIEGSVMLVSVNSGPVHIAAGLNKFTIVLYSQTNPQHKPWRTESRVLEYSPKKSMQSRNEIIRFVDRKIYKQREDTPQVFEILDAIDQRMTLRNIPAADIGGDLRESSIL